MSRNFSRRPNKNTKANLRNERRGQLRTREEVVKMLREIAFIMKMTEQIRGEIESEFRIRQPVTV
jgi:hypothetical protein